MGLSFSGPLAPTRRRPRLIPVRLWNFASSLTPLRVLAALAVACVLTAAGASAMYLTTGPEWRSLLFEPFAFLLLPGFVLEGLPRNPYFFSPGGVVKCTTGVYFVLFLYLFRGKRR